MRAIIVDDDPMNIDLIQAFCSKYAPFIDVVGMAEDVDEAIEIIIDKMPDLLFLDGILHDKTGFDIIDAIHQPDLMVVMTTAHEKFGVQAAKIRVMDYLLKPISIKEFIAATEMCKLQLEKRGPRPYGQYINVYHKDYIEIIPINDILHLKSDCNYTFITTTNEQEHMTSKSLSYYETRLPSADFLRVHKSHIVRIKGVIKLLRNQPMSLLLINNVEVPVSNSRKNDVYNRFLD